MTTLTRTQWFSFKDAPPVRAGQYELYCAAPMANPLPVLREAGLYGLEGARAEVRFPIAGIPIAVCRGLRIDSYHHIGELWWRGVHKEGA